MSNECMFKGCTSGKRACARGVCKRCYQKMRNMILDNPEWTWERMEKLGAVLPAYDAAARIQRQSDSFYERMIDTYSKKPPCRKFHSTPMGENLYQEAIDHDESSDIVRGESSKEVTFEGTGYPSDELSAASSDVAPWDTPKAKALAKEREEEKKKKEEGS